MISKNISLNENNVNDRMSYLTIRIEILKDHLKKYKDAIDPLAFEYISKDIETHERELKIRKEFPLNS